MNKTEWIEWILTGEHEEKVVGMIRNDPTPFLFVALKMRMSGLLRNEHIFRVFASLFEHPHANYVSDALEVFDKVGLLNDEHAPQRIDAVLKHPNPKGVTEALHALHNRVLERKKDFHKDYNRYVPNSLLEGQYAQRIVDVILEHPSFTEVVHILTILNEAGLFDGNHAQRIIDIILQHPNQDDLYQAVMVLCTRDYYSDDLYNNPELVELFFRSPRPSNYANLFVSHNSSNQHKIVYILKQYNRAELLDDEHAERRVHLILECPDLEALYRALIGIDERSLIKQPQVMRSWLDFILRHPKQADVEGLIVKLASSSERRLEIINALRAHPYPEDVCDAMKGFDEIKSLDSEHAPRRIDLLLRHPNPKGVAQTLYDLHGHLLEQYPFRYKLMSLLEKPYAQRIIDVILERPSFVRFVDVLTVLNTAGLFDKEHAQGIVDIILRYPNLDDLYPALIVLYQHQVLEHSAIIEILNLILNNEQAKANIEQIVMCQNLASRISVLTHLNEANALHGEYAQRAFSLVFAHPNPEYLFDALNRLSKPSLNNHTILDIILKHPSPTDFVELVVNVDQQDLMRAIRALDKTNLLQGEDARENFEKILKHPKLYFLSLILKTVSRTDVFNNGNAQTLFNSLMEHSNPFQLDYVLVIFDFTPLLEGKDASLIVNAILRHPKPEAFARALVELNERELLKENDMETTINELFQHPEPRAWAIEQIARKPLHASNKTSGSNAKIQLFHSTPILPTKKPSDEDDTNDKNPMTRP